MNSNTWNKIRYTVYQPFYDLAGSAFDNYRKRSIDNLAIQSGEKVLIVGAGTGLDLEYLADDIHITAIDITPSMVADLMQKAEELNKDIIAKVMDGLDMAFEDNTFDVVILHLIVAVIPDPLQCLTEVRRVLKPQGTIGIMDKFEPKEGAGMARKMLNPITKFLFSDINRNILQLLEASDFKIESDEHFKLGLRIIKATPLKSKAISSFPKTISTEVPESEASTSIEKSSFTRQSLEDAELDLSVFDNFPGLRTSRYILRSFTIRDAQRYHLLRSDKAAMRYMDKPAFKSRKEALNAIRNIKDDFDKGKAIWWVIEEKDENGLIGYFGIYNISIEHRSADIGYMLFPEMWNKGTMTEVMTATLPFAFNALNVHRLAANLNEKNIISEKLLLKMGFQKEALLREDYYFEGQFLNSVIYGLLSSDFNDK